MGMAGQESTGCAYLTSGNNREAGSVLPGVFCSAIPMRNTTGKNYS